MRTDPTPVAHHRQGLSPSSGAANPRPRVVTCLGAAVPPAGREGAAWWARILAPHLRAAEQQRGGREGSRQVRRVIQASPRRGEARGRPVGGPWPREPMSWPDLGEKRGRREAGPPRASRRHRAARTQRCPHLGFTRDAGVGLLTLDLLTLDGEIKIFVLFLAELW